MKPFTPLPTDHRCRRNPNEQGSVRSVLLPAACFALGLALSLLWVQRPARPGQSRQPAPELSQSTKEVLGRLTQPVEIHFYALLDSGAPAGLGAFAQRVDQLLAEYQRQASDKIALRRFDSRTNADPETALADGIKGFALDQGEGCYLGIAFLSAGRKETLPQLSPDWEPAVEADISRALERVSQPAPAPRTALPLGASNSAIALQLRQQFPNLDALPLDQALRTLREDSVKEFTAAATEMQGRVQEAQARVAQARQNGSPAEQDAAIKDLQALQAEQARRLKDIAAKAQARIDALKGLKSAK